jgi:hypothetical protein
MSEFTTNLLSSLLPVLLTAFLAWMGNRKDQARRKQIFEDAKQRIELINAYVASQKLVIEDTAELGVVKKTAAKELYDIKAFLDNKLQSLEKSSEKSESYVQRFFLLYKMRSGLASFFRATFFFMILMSIIWSFFMSDQLFAPESLKEYGLGNTFLGLLVYSIPVVLVAFLFRWLAIKYDKPTTLTQNTGAVQ